MMKRRSDRSMGRIWNMSRPRVKRIRRLGTPLPGLTRKEVSWKTYPPGHHGVHDRRRRSDYRIQLEEKQKVRWHYGVGERQLRIRFTRAMDEPGPTGANLLVGLERRLDNVVFRLGFAPTIPAARQLVSHGHVWVNGSRVNRPGHRLFVGDEVTLSERGRRISDVRAAVERGPEVRLPAYLMLNLEDRFRG